MEVNDIRIAFMLMSLMVFLGVTWWAYSPRRRGQFQDAGRYILDDGESDATANEGSAK